MPADESDCLVENVIGEGDSVETVEVCGDVHIDLKSGSISILIYGTVLIHIYLDIGPAYRLALGKGKTLSFTRP